MAPSRTTPKRSASRRSAPIRLLGGGSAQRLAVGSLEFHGIEFGIAKIRGPQIGFRQVGSREISTLSRNPAEIGSHEVRQYEDTVRQVGLREIAAAKIRTVEVNAAQVATAQVFVFQLGPGAACTVRFRP